MARRPRLVLPEVPLHVIQRGNNRQACFYADEDYLFYLDHLAEQSEKYGCTVHAYCLMTNHVQLLLTPEKAESVGLMMKGLGQRYVQYINRTYRRSGTLWEGRFKSCITREEPYVLACYRYIELNPVRACMVEHPAEYRWSSFRFNAQGEKSDFLQFHEAHTSLGNNMASRFVAYRDLFRGEMPSALLNEIRSASHGNYALGSPRFKEEVEQALGRRAMKRRAGRKSSQCS